VWYNKNMNTPITGRIYHVVDKATGEVVKVGSTIRTLEVRQREYNKTKYYNHCLIEAKNIQSSELDWYEKGNAYCPFLWHLVAAEHMEMIRVRTYRTGLLSNKQSPITQKYLGIDYNIGPFYRDKEEHSATCRKLGLVYGKIRGKTAGKLAVITGQLERARATVSPEQRAEQLKIARTFINPEKQILRGVVLCHSRWHLGRGKKSSSCSLCL
jgi:hypothetical protein